MLNFVSTYDKKKIIENFILGYQTEDISSKFSQLGDVKETTTVDGVTNQMAKLNRVS